MNETPFKFTSEEKEQTLQILERLRTAVGDTFKPGDEQHLREDIQHAFINHQIKRNVFGMNPILAALQTAEIAVNEIGLKRDGIIAILMQTSVIDGYQTIEDIQKKYGDSVAHIISGTGIGGLSPMITGDEMGVFNYVCIIAGSLSAISFALFANNVMKYND